MWGRRGRFAPTRINFAHSREPSWCVMAQGQVLLFRPRPMVSLVTTLLSGIQSSVRLNTATTWMWGRRGRFAPTRINFAHSREPSWCVMAQGQVLLFRPRPMGLPVTTLLSGIQSSVRLNTATTWMWRRRGRFAPTRINFAHSREPSWCVMAQGQVLLFRPRPMIACDNATFGDPIVGTVKHCDYMDVASSWTFCANENQFCSFTGT